MLFEDSFYLQFQQVCGAMADLAVTGLLGYSCLLLVGVLQALVEQKRMSNCHFYELQNYFLSLCLTELFLLPFL